MDEDLTPPTITPTDLGKFLLAVTKSLSSAALEVLVPEGTELLPGDTQTSH